MFITFEGGEGSGKTTQMRELVGLLERNGVDVLRTREPGGSPGAEEIRSLLVTGEPQRWTVEAEVMLFLAARVDHVQRLIKPALAAGRWVVSDRFMDSSFAYQGIVRGFGMQKLQALHYAVLEDFEPDLTLVLDIDPTIGLARSSRRKSGEDRFEKFGLDFHHKLRSAYLQIVDTFPHRCRIINADQSLDRVERDIRTAIQRQKEKPRGSVHNDKKD